MLEFKDSVTSTQLFIPYKAFSRIEGIITMSLRHLWSHLLLQYNCFAHLLFQFKVLCYHLNVDVDRNIELSREIPLSEGEKWEGRKMIIRLSK